jgi:hypothetical protein
MVIPDPTFFGLKGKIEVHYAIQIRFYGTSFAFFGLIFGVLPPRALPRPT